MAYQTSSGNYFNYTRNYNVSALTVSIWIYPTSLGSVEVSPCGLWEDSGLIYQWLISINASSKLLAAVSSGPTNFPVFATASTVANAWTHAAFVYGSSNIKLYQDGSEVASGVAPATMVSRTQATGIGARHGGSRPFPGYVAEFATWTSALSAGEVASLAKGFKASRINKPDIYIPFIREKIDVANAYAITTTGSPTVQPHPRVY